MATVQTLFTKLYIASGQPATIDDAGFEALGPYTRIAKIQSIPQRGDSSEDVTADTLDDGRREHFNGILDGGSLQIPYIRDTGDAGQAIVEAANAGNTTYTFIEESPAGKLTGYFGRLGAIEEMEATPTGYEGGMFTIRVNSARTDLTPANITLP